MTTPAEPVCDAAATAALLALAPLPSGYGDLLRSVYAACVDDPRIRAAWLGGSVARGEADAGSDLDVLLAIDDDSFDEFAGSWRDWLAAVSPTLLAQELPGLPGSFAVTTLECLRLDVVAEPVSSLETSDLPHAPGRDGSRRSRRAGAVACRAPAA
ncbi:MAG: nucleotidyltransferase domain-containing protein [Nocardioidaceae bacterium]